MAYKNKFVDEIIDYNEIRRKVYDSFFEIKKNKRRKKQAKRKHGNIPL